MGLLVLNFLAVFAHAHGSLRSLRSSQTQDEMEGGKEVRAHSPFMDDLEPVAPLDQLAEPGAISAAGVPRQGGARRPALYVPPYLYPDAFPASAKDVCHCDAPKEEKLTKEEEIWAAEVAKQLNLPLAQVMHPSDFKGVAHCDCGRSKPANGRVFRYVRSAATANSSGFTLQGADPTFPHGSYWEPEVVNSGGLMAPGDRLRPEDLPPQAPYDEVDLDENLAEHDRIPKKFAKYLDQVESHRGCDGSMESCTSLCSAGDSVLLDLGNAQREAQVLGTSAGNALEIEFATGLEGEICDVDAGCSLFRVCAPQPGLGARSLRCGVQESEEKINWKGHVERHFSCPKNTVACKRVRQVVQGLFLRKEGKPCQAA